MNWKPATLWFTDEKYELRIIPPNLWVIYGPDGWANCSDSMVEAKALAEAHLKTHPLPNDNAEEQPT